MPMQLPYSKCLSVGRCDLDSPEVMTGRLRGTRPDGGRPVRKVAPEVVVRAGWVPSAGIN